MKIYIMNFIKFLDIDDKLEAARKIGEYFAVFDISLWHKGCELTEGEKYWIGCEIISKF